MDIDYITQVKKDILGEKELQLIHQAENDKQNGRLTTYTNHRDILGR